MERRRSKRFLTLKDRLALYANEVREGASLLPARHRERHPTQESSSGGYRVSAGRLGRLARITVAEVRPPQWWPLSFQNNLR
jgi:hypothetical protein